MTPQLEIGIASYRSPEKLKRAIHSIYAMTEQPFELNIWHNKSGTAEDDECMKVIVRYQEARATFRDNVGYAGAVNGLLAPCQTPYFAYCDNDVEVRTKGWDTRMMEVLDKNQEVAQVFPGSGHYGFFNGQYHECLWNAGYCWMLKREPVLDALIGQSFRETFGGAAIMDCTLGHHEEVDLMIRLRLAGFQIACLPDVNVFHNGTSTQSPESAKRIHAGVVRWMNKWNRYFCGDVLKYPNPDPDSGEGYDPRSLRYTDWPPCALYLERMTLAMFPEWNKSPRVVNVPGVGEMDAVEILKPKGCYIGRAI